LRKGLLIALAIALLGIPGTRDLIIDGLGPDRGQARAQPKPARRWEMNNLSPFADGIMAVSVDGKSKMRLVKDGTQPAW